MFATLNAQNVTDLFSAGPIRLKWDPKLLRLNQVSPGDFLKQDISMKRKPSAKAESAPPKEQKAPKRNSSPKRERSVRG